MCFVVFSKTGLLIGWALLAVVAYKASQVELDFAEFDPYNELQIDRVSQTFMLLIIILSIPVIVGGKQLSRVVRLSLTLSVVKNEVVLEKQGVD